ncbi:glycosyltransferase involved in cell wall biosynthesis [Arthrobacter pigmenti]|uniref:Glycosyltransferase involved in cell wall biosynthesis n=1 Tax=Arthrobacter pigmenti TaxID=271432 RepID=A0A846RHB4_9MICC|nr:glycosyltransferase family 2 protein [Arthrobacter pigmenti]NJC22638.1 glycosyltransferase involved in cell wall biosynthesis [Arthrobacter pigmenti]
MASDGNWDWNDIGRAIEAYRMGGSPKKAVMTVLKSTPRVRLLQLADLCFRQNCLPQDLENAATLYSIAYRLDGPTDFLGKKRSEFFLDAISRSGDREKAQELLPLLDGGNVGEFDRSLYESNATRPRGRAGQDETEWLNSINRMYQSAGLVGIRLVPGDDPAFLRLSSEPAPAVIEGPLVSVVMPVFQPDDATELAIRSALQQTYQNIEVIVVDDGSGPEYVERLNRIAEQDHRLDIIFNEVNSGAYTSRNIGYQRVRGKYMTVFDGDDWQHPQKLELLVREAERISDGQLVSARWTRVDENLHFQYRGWRGAYITPAHVSALFPVAQVRKKLGHWDTVRKAADTEFILRYQLLINEAEPLEVSQAPLTLSLVGTANLSIEDFRLGYRAPDRVSYRAAYEHWHNRIRAGEDNGYLKFPLRERRFPAPARFLPNRPKQEEIEVLIVGDLAESTRAAGSLVTAAEGLAKAGKRVAVMNVPSLLSSYSFTDGMSVHLMELLRDGEVTRVARTDELSANTVVVTDPTAFQFAQFIESSVVAKNLYVLADAAPYDTSKKRHTYEVFTVSQNLEHDFQMRPMWVPTSDRAATVLSRIVSENDLLPLPTEQGSAGAIAADDRFDVHLDRVLAHALHQVTSGGVH